MANEHDRRALRDIGELMDTQRYSDLTISCAGREFKVHKNIMCAASSVIAAECDSKMKEAESGVIEHLEFDTDTVEHMISYVYKQTYSLPEDLRLTIPIPLRAEEADSPNIAKGLTGVNAKLLAHVKVYGIGDFYEIPCLQLLATEKFEATASVSWELEGFIEVVKEVYKRTSTDELKLRNALHAVAMAHIGELTGDHDFMTDLAEREDLQDFAAQMLRQMVKQRDRHLTMHREEVKRLQAEVATLRQAQTAAEGEAQNSEDVMGHLVRGVSAMPSQCKSTSCSRALGAFTLERGFSAKYGVSKGNWTVRCKHCRCRLVS